MATFWRFFCVLYFQRAARNTFQTCILNLHQGHTVCGSMVDIQSPSAEIRRGKKEERRNHRMKIYMACPITQGGHKILLNPYHRPNLSYSGQYISRESYTTRNVYLLITRVCVCVGVLVGLSVAACPHNCADPDVTGEMVVSAPYSCVLLGVFVIGARVSML